MSDFWPSSQPVWTEGGAILLLPLLVLLLLFLWMMLWFQRTSLRNEQSCCVVNINRKEANSRSRPFCGPQRADLCVFAITMAAGEQRWGGEKGCSYKQGGVCRQWDREWRKRRKEEQRRGCHFCFCLFEVKHVSEVGDAISLSLPNTACWSLGSAADRWARCLFHASSLMLLFILPDFVAKMLKPAGDFSLAASPNICF